MAGEAIFIVEDEGVTAMVLQDSLEDMGYRVCGIAASGEEAIRKIAETKPNLVLMDISIQGDMDGIDTALLITENQRIPIIFLTAYADQKILARAKINAPYAYIVKPFEDRELHSNIEIALYKHKIDESNRQCLARYWQLFMNNPGALCVLDKVTGQLEEVNISARSLFGFGRDEFLRMTISDIYTNPDKSLLENELKGEYECRKTCGTRKSRSLFRKKDGSIFQGEICFWLADINGQEKLIGCIEDASLRLRFEENELLAAFQAGVAELSSSLLHNIGNVIMGLSHRAEQIGESSSELHETGAILSNIENLVQRKTERGMSPQQVLDELISVVGEVGNKLKDLSNERFTQDANRIKHGIGHIAEIIKIQQQAAHPTITTTIFKIEDLLRDAVAIQAEGLEKYAVQVDIQTNHDLGEIELPHSQLLQVMINLIKNSREAVTTRWKEAGGNIRIVVTPQENAWLEIRVTDNGCGISNEKIERIFKYGFSTKKRSSGFGLFSVQNFIESLQGTITVNSEGENKGAEFILRLPLKASRNE